MINMASFNSFKAYGKVNEADQQKQLEAQRKTRKRIAIVALSSIILVGVIVAAVVGSIQNSREKSEKNGGSQSFSTSVKAVCDVTLYKESCLNSLAPMANNATSHNIQPEELFKLSIQVAINELSKASQHFNDHGYFNGIKDIMSMAALKNCHELLGLAMDHLNSSFSSSNGLTLLEEAIDDLKTWLSAAGTYQATCIDGFENATDEALKSSVAENLINSTELTSNSLAIITWISNVASSIKLRRRLMGFPYQHQVPKWLHGNDRKLLESSDLRKNADAVVAKDGSGKYKTIGAALKAVPDKSNKRFVIYVKKGVYYENVNVEKSKWNVTMVGDGKDATVVSASLNFVDGTPTFATATFAVFGKGFVARDMGFRNNAGAIKHQAVALMSSADQSIFYRCRIDAFQDTLYAHANRQFYRECDIYGTVDFIFGNAAVILQNCNILPKTPLLGQQNTITAQGKIDPNQNTGICIQNCTILPSGNLTSVKTYLGRPWKAYSTTIYMQSMMGSFIDPTGWLPWTGNTAPDTIIYSEYQNFGPGGAYTKNRVKWKGLRSINSKEASKFTLNSFFQGDKWISAAGVKYKSGL